LKRKFDNFWYHYKVVFIIGVIIFIFLVFCVVQCAMKIKGDVDIAYIGGLEINAENHEDLQRALDELLGEDLNGDKKTYVDFTQYSYMTSSQIENARAKGQPVDIQSIMAVQTQIDLMLADGSILIYLIDAEIYRDLSQRPGVFMPLEDALGYFPENYANDAFSIKLGALPCRDYYSGIYIFPSNTVLVMRDMQVSEEGNAKIQEKYDRSLLLFKRLVEFTFGSDSETGED